MIVSELKPGNLFRYEFLERGQTTPVECLVIAPNWFIRLDQPLAPVHIELIMFPFETVELVEPNAASPLPWAVDYLENRRYCCMGYEMKTEPERRCFHHLTALVGAGYNGLPHSFIIRLYGV